MGRAPVCVRFTNVFERSIFDIFLSLPTEHFFGFGANPEKVGGKCREPYSKGQEELYDGNVDDSV